MCGDGECGRPAGLAGERVRGRSERLFAGDLGCRLGNISEFRLGSSPSTPHRFAVFVYGLIYIYSLLGSNLSTSNPCTFCVCGLMVCFMVSPVHVYVPCVLANWICLFSNLFEGDEYISNYIIY